MGIAKYLSRTGKEIQRSQLVAKLGIDDQNVLQIGFEELQQYGYIVQVIKAKVDDHHFQPSDVKIRITSVSLTVDSSKQTSTITKQFIQAANEVIFQQQFFDRQLTAIA